MKDHSFYQFELFSIRRASKLGEEAGFVWSRQAQANRAPHVSFTLFIVNNFRSSGRRGARASDSFQASGPCRSISNNRAGCCAKSLLVKITEAGIVFKRNRKNARWLPRRRDGRAFNFTHFFAPVARFRSYRRKLP